MGVTQSKQSNTQEESFKEACAEVRASLVGAERGDVLARHRIGIMVLGVRNTAKFGENGVARMEGELCLDEKTLYRYGRVAGIWSADELSALTSKLNAKSMALSWSHWELLAGVEDGRTRRGLLSRALTECLTVKGLTAAIKGNGSPKESAEVKDGSATRNVGTRASGHLAQLLSSVAKEARALEEGILPKIAAGITNITDSELSECRATLESIEAVETILGSLKSQLKKVTTKATTAPTNLPPPSIRSHREGKMARKVDAEVQALLLT